MIMKMNIISEKPLIVDYSDMDDKSFMHFHVTDILRDSDDASKGVYGLCRAGAFGRLVRILTRAGAPEPTIVNVINDPEAELTYELE
jgi:hypothetical protein